MACISVTMRVLILTIAASCSVALPAQSSNDARGNAIWKGTSMDGPVEELKMECMKTKDTMACLKYKMMSLLDQFFKKDSFKVSEGVSVIRNSYVPKSPEARGDAGSVLEDYVQTHDLLMELPSATLALSPRNLDDNELQLSLKFDQPRAGDVEEARKSKLKKILIPIMVFVLLKAMTLVPLFIGALGLKAWNALQLAFFSFVISVGLAIFQLCKKIAADSSLPHVSAHAPWESHYGKRSVESHALAYNAYAQDA